MHVQRAVGSAPQCRILDCARQVGGAAQGCDRELELGLDDKAASAAVAAAAVVVTAAAAASTRTYEQEECGQHVHHVGRQPHLASVRDGSGDERDTAHERGQHLAQIAQSQVCGRNRIARTFRPRSTPSEAPKPLNLLRIRRLACTTAACATQAQATDVLHGNTQAPDRVEVMHSFA